MRKLALLALAASTLTITPAVAKDKKPYDPNKKSCRREETTGTIMGGKLVCHTSAEWADIDAERQSSARSMRDHMGRSNGGT